MEVGWGGTHAQPPPTHHMWPFQIRQGRQEGRRSGAEGRWVALNVGHFHAVSRGTGEVVEGRGRPREGGVCVCVCGGGHAPFMCLLQADLPLLFHGAVRTAGGVLQGVRFLQVVRCTAGGEVYCMGSVL